VNAKKEQLAHKIADEFTSNEQTHRRLSCLEVAAYRAEYEREMVKSCLKASAEGGENGILGGAITIDWHNFLVVETIEFRADKVIEALTPLTLLRMAVLTKE
jgi:hypothetical protein